MVLDPITAASLAGNIIQFVDYSIKVVSRLDDFRERHGEVPRVFSNIRVRLPLLVDSLSRSKAGIAQGTVPDKTQDGLVSVVDGCLGQIKLLNAILDKILPVKGESWITRNRKALQSLAQERSVEKIEGNLHRYIEALTLHHVIPSIDGGASDS